MTDAPKNRELRIVFDGPPSHESGRFVEVENEEGKGRGVGQWRERKDGSGLWDLVFTEAACRVYFGGWDDNADDDGGTCVIDLAEIVRGVIGS